MINVVITFDNKISSYKTPFDFVWDYYLTEKGREDYKHIEVRQTDSVITFNDVDFTRDDVQ